MVTYFDVGLGSQWPNFVPWDLDSVDVMVENKLHEVDFGLSGKAMECPSF